MWLIGRLTFLEAVRQKFFNFLVLLSLALIGSSLFFRMFDFGASELRFIADFGLGGIFFFGSILSVVATAQLFFSEIENRTALTILAKPVRRWSFIAGKFAGVALLLLVFVAMLTALLGAMMWWREGEIAQRLAEQGGTFPDSERVQLWGLAICGLLQWFKFAVLAAVTILVASFSNTNLYTVVVAFFIELICQLQYIAVDSWKDVQSPALQTVVWLLSKVFPNFQLFSIGELLVFPMSNPVPDIAVAAALGYGVFYVVVILALAVFSFTGREI
jgi:ABC-type transport system involved in multi-copper enzyme maturation permease subunit